MKIEKKVIKESLGLMISNNKKFSSKKQNIILSESQLEKLLLSLRKL